MKPIPDPYYSSHNIDPAEANQQSDQLTLGSLWLVYLSGALSGVVFTVVCLLFFK